MQQKNFVLFIVLCVAILAGWMWFQNQMWPRKNDDQPAKQKTPEEKKLPPRPLALDAQRLVLPRLAALPAIDDLGLVNVLALATEMKLTADFASIPPNPLRYARHQTAALIASPTLGSYATLLHRLSFGPVLPEAPTAPTETPRDIALSDPNFYLDVVVTTRGAGVRRLTLPKFQAASDLGKPLSNKNDKMVPLHLIPDDPIRPSFLMYHYPHPTKDADARDPAKRSIPSTLLGQSVWKIEEPVKNVGEYKRVVLSFDRIPGYHDPATGKGVKILKTYTLGPKDYHIGVQIEIRDERHVHEQKGQKFRYQLAGAHGLPIEGEWYASTYLTPMIGEVNNKDGTPTRDLDETQQRIVVRAGGERVPLPSTERPRSIQYAGVADQYFASLIVVDDKQEGGIAVRNVVDYVRPTLESEEVSGQVLNINGDWLEIEPADRKRPEDKFRLLARAKESLSERNFKRGDHVLVNFYTVPGARSREGWVATGVRPGKVLRPHLDDITVRVVSMPVDLRPGQATVHKFLLYNGPVKISLLGQFRGDMAVAPELVERYWETLNLRTLTDYHSPGPLGTFANSIYWTDLIILTTRLMHWLLDKLHFLVPNYGLAIILLTLIVRGLMFPISRRQAHLSIKMQELAPEVRKVQEKYKNDPQGRNKAVMELYRKHNVNPLGGCLTLLLQMPIFMGLYYCLQESIHFRLAGFLWIDNLAAPDMMVWWTENIPVLSDPDSMGVGFFCFPTNPFYLGPYFNLLPVVAVAFMLVQQKMMTPPAADDQQAFQQKMMKWMMVFFGLMFYKIASGLCLYFIVSSVWGLAERKLLPKRTPLAGASGGGSGGSGGGGGGGGGGPGKGPGAGGGGRGKNRPGKKEKQPAGRMQKVRNWWQEVLKQAKKK